MPGTLGDMPISPKYEWTETDATLEVRVTVPGVSRAKADVFATDAFLKVNCPPYLFALDLHANVDDSHSSATITSEGVTFKLHKVRACVRVVPFSKCAECHGIAGTY